jgi:hypothetical protein
VVRGGSTGDDSAFLQFIDSTAPPHAFEAAFADASIARKSSLPSIRSGATLAKINSSRILPKASPSRSLLAQLKVASVPILEEDTASLMRRS